MRSFYEPDEDDIRLLEAVGPLRPNVAALGRAAREALEDDAHERSLRSVVAAAPAPAACCSGETHRAAVQALVAGGRR